MKTSKVSRFPVVAARNLVVFPGLAFPMRVAREESVAALKAAQASDGLFLTLLQKTDVQKVNIEDLESIGTVCRIEQIKGSAADGYQVFARGLGRFEASSLARGEGEFAGCIVGEGCERSEAVQSDAVLSPNQDSADDGGTSPANSRAGLLDSLKALSKEILRLVPSDTREIETLLDGVDDLSFLVWLCAANVDLPAADRQMLLALDSVEDRALKMSELLKAHRNELQVRTEIREKLTEKLGKSQREAILREQMRAIKEELGEGAGGTDEKDDLRKRIESAALPEKARKAVEDELNRFESMPASSPEHHIIRSYLELIANLPWSKSSDSKIDLVRARDILDEEHFGLDRIKKRIVQHLGVMKLKATSRGSILLLVGPPGVGKTSLGQSVAKALGREFVRGSLGGVRDDSEIRGHRRTYVGAMPGRIIQGLKRAGTDNPVFMLDEIDKLGRGYQGDPAGALLEVLDPEQNATFLDHYLDLPFDLSKVFFIATANSLEGIPGPLLDRMEVIDLGSYTTAEKLHIGKRHLLPKQLSENGFLAGQIEISDEAFLRIVTHYTREAGVRELQRKIAAVCRSLAERALALAEGQTIRIESTDLEDALGPERFAHEIVDHASPPGVATGLAWTPTGGEILFIEASLMEGSGKLTLTGQLGDTMKESAQIALSVVRSKLSARVSKLDYSHKDIHIHVPGGGIPKDGPSAGIAMVTTIASLFAGRPVSPKLAMTGEVTLRGAVMPVGGVKEKVLGAHRAGIDRIILPLKNKKDLAEIPEETRAQIRFDFVETADEVLALALGLEPEPSSIAIPPLGGEAASPAIAVA